MAKRKDPIKSHRTQRQFLSPGQMNITREVDYIIQRAQEHDARLVVLASLVLFSTETGDAWILDSEENAALCLARDGEKQTFTVFDTTTQFGIEWTATYHIEGDTFIVREESGQKRIIIGYPTREILHATRHKLK
ncbi:MAG: hypothetical protein QMD04_05840 [Anaerolineales bacterium]|nr:hypothetical protein [Anaerolineales bacterium]